MNKWDIYLQEAKTQAEFAKKSYLAFRQAEKESLVFDVFFHLHHFLVHATNIDRILDSKLGSERHTILAGHLDLSGIDPKPFRRLRNPLWGRWFKYNLTLNGRNGSIGTYAETSETRCTGDAASCDGPGDRRNQHLQDG